MNVCMMNGRTGNILMKKIFTKPKTVKELYEFFTYGLPLNPNNYRNCNWHVNATCNSIKNRNWRIYATVHSHNILLDYYSGSKTNHWEWYLDVYRET
jgi:hypothetical protein